MTELRLRAENVHEVAVQGRRVLFHVPTSSLFDLDGAGGGVLDGLRAGPARGADLVARLEGSHAPAALREAIDEMVRLRVVEGQGAAAERARAAVPADALSTLVLNVTTGCNLACSYCYKEDLQAPAKASRLSAESGRAAIDLLLRESGGRRRVNLTFFGGEPLTALPLIRSLTDFAEQRAAETGKAVDFSLTTNGTLLDEETVAWLDAHRFGITVSMDGPAEVQDRNRRTPGGQGTYAVVAPKVRMLLDRYRARPVGARVTMTAGMTDVVAVHRHLKDELGFAEVGFAPVTAGLPAGHGLDAEETTAFVAGLKALGRRWLDAALAGCDIGFTNLSQLLAVLHEGTGKLIPCGAGVSLLAVDTEGLLQLCHRFSGSATPSLGDVESGIDRGAVAAFVDRALLRAEACRACWVRHLCAGGCYHEAYERHGDPFRITDHYCASMRDWVDFGIRVYVELMAGNPGFFRHRIASGRQE